MWFFFFSLDCTGALFFDKRTLLFFLSGHRHDHGGLLGRARMPLRRDGGGPVGAAQGRHQSRQVRLPN